MRLLSLIFALLIWSSTASAIELTKDDEAKLRAEVAIAVEAVRGGNTTYLIDHMPDRAIELFGGREQAMRVVNALKEELKAEGMTIDLLEVREITPAFMVGDTTICFVKNHTIARFGKIRAGGPGFFVASREKNSTEWKFLDGTGVTDDPSLLPKIYPGWDPATKLPESSEAIIPE